MNNKNISPDLIKALMRWEPDYFSWNNDQQEMFHLNKLEEISKKINNSLLKSIFDVSVTLSKTDSAIDELSIDQMFYLNRALLPIQGIGCDAFYLNESFKENTTLKDFKTLYDYDYDDFNFQEKWRKKDNDDYKGSKYRGTLNFTWARLMLDENFTYAMLSIKSNYITSELDSHGNEHIEHLIPHEYKLGPNHGKKQGDGYLYDMKTFANGKEQQLKELKKRYWKHLIQLNSQMAIEFNTESKNEVFMIDESTPNDPSLHFVFSDADVLKKIQFSTFVNDCRQYEQKDHDSFQALIENKKSELKNYLDLQLKDIMKNHDPSIIKISKKRKVVVHKDSGLMF
ncbi:MAG: hypothetical protein L3J83_02110 [Proteobacteria bacterium]|nr:hypothetical protein [Pseudomonadota bacterium]